eukprot:g16191.t1
MAGGRSKSSKSGGSSGGTKAGAKSAAGKASSDGAKAASKRPANKEKAPKMKGMKKPGSGSGLGLHQLNLHEQGPRGPQGGAVPHRQVDRTDCDEDALDADDDDDDEDFAEQLEDGEGNQEDALDDEDEEQLLQEDKKGRREELRELEDEEPQQEMDVEDDSPEHARAATDPASGVPAGGGKNALVVNKEEEKQKLLDVEGKKPAAVGSASRDTLAAAGDPARTVASMEVEDVGDNVKDVEMKASQDDDPVIATAPVTLAHFADPLGFNADFYCVKYPTRPTYRGYGDREQLVRIDVQKNKKLARFGYAFDKDAVLGGGGGGGGSSCSQHRNPDSKYANLRNLYLNSNRLLEDDCSYFAGAVRNGEFRLTPITAGILQMRADISHVDVGAAAANAARSGGGADDLFNTALSLDHDQHQGGGLYGAFGGGNAHSSHNVGTSGGQLGSSSKKTGGAAGAGGRQNASAGEEKRLEDQEAWVPQTLFSAATHFDESEEICYDYILGPLQNACPDSGSQLVYAPNQVSSTPLRDQFLAPGGAVTGTTKRSAASSAPDVKAKMHRDQHGAPTSMISGSGHAASSSSSAPAGEAQLQNASERQLEAARLRYFEALTQPNLVESGGGGGHNRGYKPPRNGISDFGLARLGVKEQFEMLIRSHGYGALPANFHHIFFTRLPPATRKYLRNVDTMFGGIVRTKKGPSLPDSSLTASVRELGPEDAALANQLCLANYCVLAGAMIPQNNPDHYSNWVAKSSTLGITGYEKIARDTLLMLFVIGKSSRSAVLETWKNKMSSLVPPDVIMQVERDLIGATEIDVSSGHKNGRLKYYDAPDVHLDEWVLSRYCENYIEQVKSEMVRPVRELMMKKEAERALGKGMKGVNQRAMQLQAYQQQAAAMGGGAGTNPGLKAGGKAGAGGSGSSSSSSATTDDPYLENPHTATLRKIFFDMRSLLASRAYAEDELVKKLQAGFPRTQISPDMVTEVLGLKENLIVLDNSSSVEAQQPQPLIKRARCLTISEEALRGLTELNQENTGPPWRLHRQCKYVYYYSHFPNALLVGREGSSQIRQTVLDLFEQTGVASRDEVLAAILSSRAGNKAAALPPPAIGSTGGATHEDNADQSAGGFRFPLCELRKTITEFAQWKSDRYVFHGFVGKL